MCAGIAEWPILNKRLKSGNGFLESIKAVYMELYMTGLSQSQTTPSNPFWDFAGVALRGRGELFQYLIRIEEWRLLQASCEVQLPFSGSASCLLCSGALIHHNHRCKFVQGIMTPSYASVHALANPNSHYSPPNASSILQTYHLSLPLLQKQLPNRQPALPDEPTIRPSTSVDIIGYAVR
jgi:hypothetical protein